MDIIQILNAYFIHEYLILKDGDDGTKKYVQSIKYLNKILHLPIDYAHIICINTTKNTITDSFIKSSSG
jgi:hypothetical protein